MEPYISKTYRYIVTKSGEPSRPTRQLRLISITENGRVISFSGAIRYDKLKEDKKHTLLTPHTHVFISFTQHLFKISERVNI